MHGWRKGRERKGDEYRYEDVGNELESGIW